jgi:hypothetical protein
VRGDPSASMPRPPRLLKDSIRLVNIYLPPYPCLPLNMGDMQSEILTTRIGNINYLAQRQTNQTIAIPVAPGTPNDTQPRAYSMAQIGTLDRRIQALEYYTSLSLLQTDMVNKVVPSSVNGTLNRFKFGYFVDDFSSALSQDVTNPGYAAAISSSNMTPPTVEWIVGYGDARAASVDYMDFPIISQPDATTPIVLVPPPPPLVVPPVSANVWLLRTDHLAPSLSGQVVLTDYAYPVFSDTTNGTATLYFSIPVTTSQFGNNVFIDPDNIKIYQGTTLISDAYVNSVGLTAADQAFLKSAAVPGQFFNSTVFAPLGKPATGWVNGSGKMIFAHNKALGTQYTVLTTRQSLYDHWIYGMQYPSQFGETIVAPPTTGTPTYAGHMDVQPATMLLALTTPTNSNTNMIQNWGGKLGYLSGGFGPQSGNGGDRSTGLTGTNYATLGIALSRVVSGGGSGYSQVATQSTAFIPQSFGITVYGLRPLTTHTVTINGINKNARCAMPGTAPGASPLITDAFGILVFNWFFDGNAADQDIKNIFIGPLSSEVSWATQAAASLVQPIADGSLSMSVSAPGSSASFALSVVVDPELLLHTVGPTHAAIAAAWT